MLRLLYIANINPKFYKTNSPRIMTKTLHSKIREKIDAFRDKGKKTHRVVKIFDDFGMIPLLYCQA